MKGGFMNDFSIVLAIPPQPVLALFRSGLLQHDANGIGEAHRIMRSVWGQKEHFAFPDWDVSMFTIVDDLEKHGAAVLVEPLGGFIDMEIGARIGTANDLLSC